MTIKIIIILSSVIILLIGYGVIITKKSIKLKSQIKDINKNEKINKQTNEKIKNITSGNIDADFNYGINVLHNLSKK